MADGCYLLHFDPPYLHARHYTGWSADIAGRVLEHVRPGGRGSPLVAAAVAAGCRVHVARVWLGADRDRERRLKRSGGAARYCPTCRARAGRPIRRGVA